MQKDRPYKWQVQQYTGIDNDIKSDCNAIIFYNAGATAVAINNFPLAAKDRLILGGNENEIDTTIYTASFTTGSGLLIVMRKYYTQ